jgi:hypothetical protein
MVLSSHILERPDAAEVIPMSDPVTTNPDLYRVVFENERVRVLAYDDRPGDRTLVHHHPDSVMVTLSAFRRRVSHDDRHVDVDLPAGEVRWLAAQEHRGENTGDSVTRALFIELKEPVRSTAAADSSLGPQR